MRGKLVHALRWLVFVLAAVAMNFPVIATLVTSLKSDAEISSNASIWIQHVTFANYAAIFAMSDRFDILHFLANSLIASGIGSVLAIVLAFPAAYAMVRFGTARHWLLPLVVNLRAIPLIIFAIPVYLMYQQVGLLDTRFGLGLILCLVNVPLVLILLSTAIAEIPIEIEEAAPGRRRGHVPYSRPDHRADVAQYSGGRHGSGLHLFMERVFVWIDDDNACGNARQCRRILFLRRIRWRRALGRRSGGDGACNPATIGSGAVALSPDRNLADGRCGQGIGHAASRLMRKWPQPGRRASPKRPLCCLFPCNNIMPQALGRYFAVRYLR